MTTGEGSGAFARLSSRSIGLKRIVNTLKNDYVNARFGTASEAEAESSVYNITGSPQWTASTNNMRQTLLTCYENLARLAVLTRLTREAEQHSPRDRVFAGRFQTIEGHPESGLYVIMCDLHVVMASWNIEVMSNETIAKVSSIRFVEGLSEASRHVRDYIVLRVLETSADQLSSNFDRLVGQVHSQATPSTTE